MEVYAPGLIGVSSHRLTRRWRRVYAPPGSQISTTSRGRRADEAELPIVLIVQIRYRSSLLNRCSSYTGI